MLHAQCIEVHISMLKALQSEYGNNKSSTFGFRNGLDGEMTKPAWKMIYNY